MTEEAQRVALAEVCGWRYVTNELHFNKLYHPGAVPPIGKCCGKHISKEEAFRSSFDIHPETVYLVPDYLHSLDAMHEAEKVLTPAQQLTFYRCLVDAGDRNRDGTQRFGQTVYWETVHATAAIKAAAILRTLNFWDDMK